MFFFLLLLFFPSPFHSYGHGGGLVERPLDRGEKESRQKVTELDGQLARGTATES